MPTNDPTVSATFLITILVKQSELTNLNAIAEDIKLTVDEDGLYQATECKPWEHPSLT